MGHETEGTLLGRTVGPQALAHPNRSGFYALRAGRGAFAARVLLADAAERSLDVQYYLWHDDLSGGLLLAALRRAAERGVRVRLLLDDNNTAGLDDLLAAMNAQPNVEVRLFNPYRCRRWRLPELLFDFDRLNRRMHNKSFTADGQAAILGGRNVGDEYFDAGHGTAYADLDVLAVGPIVADVERDFERYWTSASARPAGDVLPPAGAAALAALEAACARGGSAAAQEYEQALAEEPFVRGLLAGELPLEWAPSRLLSDDPRKGLGRAPDSALLWPRLQRLLSAPTRELLLVSPYFVPGAAGVRGLAALARRGVQVKVLTNALEATDVPAVHAGYARRRKPLLLAGVRLFELKRAAAAPRVRARGPAGSSDSSLHAKTFAVDDARLFVGSFNFDPRSARLNTEMGLVIDSTPLARAASAAVDREIRDRSYEVRLSRAGSLRWVEQRDGVRVVHKTEPNVSLGRRALVAALSLLPIEWLL